jgi:tetratricopeptide (TPR) repeat protein
MAMQADERTAALRALLSVALVAYVGTLIAGDRSSPTVAALTYLVAIAGSVVLHELAHALAVRLIGGRVMELRLGFGPRLSPAGWLDLRPLLIAGHVSWVPPKGARRGQVFAVGVAGIAVHALLILLALAAGSGRWPVWRIDLLLANVGAFASNAIPSRGSLTTTAGGPNDGAQLLGLVRDARSPEPFLLGNDPDLVAMRAAYGPGGLRAALDAAAHRPDRAQLRLRLAAELLTAGRYADAAGAARAAAGAAPGWALDQVLAEALLLDRLTAAAPIDLAEAVAAAERAQAGRSEHLPAATRAGAAHTLSLARLAQGRDAEAEASARWAEPATTAPGPRAAVLATIGWAALRQGRPQEAHAALRDAMTLAPDEPLTRALAAAVASTPA